MKPTPPTIIIGMHRSGTSMLTRFLDHVGVFVGEKLDMNHEALFFYKLNKWLLQQANATWDNPHNFDFINQHFKDNTTEVLLQNLKGQRRLSYLGYRKGLKYGHIQKLDFPWCWKDPANTITLDLWRGIFPNAKIVFIHRHPLDVATSLAARTEKRMATKFRRNWKVKLKEKLLYKEPIYAFSYRTNDTFEAVKLWEHYNKKALEHREKIPATHFHSIQYEALLQEPERHFAALLDFLNLKVENSRISEFNAKLDSSRIYNFLNNTELVKVYDEIKSREMVMKLGYGE